MGFTGGDPNRDLRLGGELAQRCHSLKQLMDLSVHVKCLSQLEQSSGAESFTNVPGGFPERPPGTAMRTIPSRCGKINERVGN